MLILNNLVEERAIQIQAVQCTVYSVSAQCTVHSAQCTVHSVQCTVHSARCTVYSVQCTVYSVSVHSKYKEIQIALSTMFRSAYYPFGMGGGC